MANYMEHQVGGQWENYLPLQSWNSHSQQSTPGMDIPAAEVRVLGQQLQALLLATPLF